MEGRQVGSYIIERKIGEGGMGVVYSARHVRMTGRAVVKMLHARYASDPKITRRFENEANAAASIGHPGIVTVFDIGHADDGSLFIAMELLEGESLQQRINRTGALPLPQAVSIVRQAVSALGAAHAEGIVHRDLKPDNLFLVPDPEVAGGERVKLLDFGIAKLAGDSPEGMKTGTGAMMGTPHFMSPEQCRGAGEVDHRSDLYSMGCILFLLVTGQMPFVGTGAGDYVAAHLTATPPKVRSLRPDAPEYLEELVSVLLAKDPNERFGSAQALLTALDGLLSRPGTHPPITGAGAAQSSSPGLASTPTTMSASSGPSRSTAGDGQSGRSRRRVWLAAPVLLAALGAGGYALQQGRGSGQDASAEPTPKPIAAAEIDAGRPALSEPTLGIKALERYRNPGTSGISDFNSKSWWLAVAADFEQAAKQAEAPPLWTAGATLARGFIALLEGRADEASTLFLRASEEHPSWPLPHATLSLSLTRQGKLDEALEASHAAQRLAPEWPGGIAASARVLVAADRLDDAMQEYRRALNLDGEDPNIMSELALVYHAAHIDSEAQRYAKDALALNPDLVSARILLAERALEGGEADLAATEAARALAVSPRSISAQLAYADALAMQEEKDRALAAYRKAIELYDSRQDASSSLKARIDKIRGAVAKGRLPRTGKDRDRSKQRRSNGDRSMRPESPASNFGRSSGCGSNDPLCGL